MNKKVAKGALAAVVAVLLLLGGAGSYALWSDSDSADAGQITAGTLDISLVGTGQWEDVSPGAINSGPIADINTFRIVPGDVLRYNANFRIGASGENLRATVTGTQSDAVISPDLAPYVDIDTTATINGAALPANEITEANDGDTVDVAITVTFDSATPDQDGQNGTINLQNFQVTLQQVRT